MMTRPTSDKTPHQTAKEQAEAKNADVMRALEQSKAQGQRADDFDGNVVMATSEIGQMLDELISELDGVEK